MSQMGPPSHKTNPRPSLSHGGVQISVTCPRCSPRSTPHPFGYALLSFATSMGCPAGLACRCKPHFAIVTDEAMKYHAPTAAERVREILRGLAQTGARRERAPGFA